MPEDNGQLAKAPAQADPAPQPVGKPVGTPVGTPVEEAEDPREKVSRLRAEASRIEASLPPPDLPPGRVRIRVEEPHSEFTAAGVTVGRGWTEVHQLLAPALFQSAAEAGVTLTQEG